MANPPAFFDKWVGRIVEFTNTTEPAGWILEVKYAEGSDQATLAQYFEYPGLQGEPSAAYGAFRCRNIYNPSEIAFMRIIMQIPCAGFEYATSTERARHAADVLTDTPATELKCLQALTKNNCKAAPLIKRHQVMKQDSDGMVPGGFLHYILMDHAPGVELKRTLRISSPGNHFWSLSFDERERIRDAFREAWKECLRAGVSPTLGQLYWDSKSSKVSIGGFKNSDLARPTDKWTDVEWVNWQLADCPVRDIWSGDVHGDKDKWTL